MTAPQSAPNVTSTSTKESVKWTAPQPLKVGQESPSAGQGGACRHYLTDMRAKTLPIQTNSRIDTVRRLDTIAESTDRRHRLKEQGMRATILSLIIFVAPAGNAQQIYKCVKGADVSYQSSPCADTHSTARQWEAIPEPEPPVAEFRYPYRKGGAESARVERAAGKDRARSASRGRNISSTNAADRRCSAAKARREAKLVSVGLKRTFDLLRKLDDAVHEACKP